MSENWRLRPWHQTPADHPQQPTRCEHVNRREQPARTKRPGQKHHETDIALSLTQTISTIQHLASWPSTELLNHRSSTCVLGITCLMRNFTISDESARLNCTVIRDYKAIFEDSDNVQHDMTRLKTALYHTTIPF